MLLKIIKAFIELFPASIIFQEEVLTVKVLNLTDVLINLFYNFLTINCHILARSVIIFKHVIL